MSKPGQYTPENMIKGRIAEAIIEELLKASGNDVYRFGYESILQNLVQKGSNFDRRNNAPGEVDPRLCCAQLGGKQFFSRSEISRQSELGYKRSVPKTQPKLILVTVTKPYFRIVTPESLLDDGCNFESLDTDPDFHVTRTAVESFEPLVERFLVNGKSSANSLPAQECREVKV